MQRNRFALSGTLALLALAPVMASVAHSAVAHPAVAHPPVAHPEVAHPAPVPHAAFPTHPVREVSPEQQEQESARRARQAGDVYSLHIILQRVLPTMPGMQYLGLEYDGEAMAYRLKFIRDGRVVFVDVDARTGQVLGRTH